MIFISTKCHYSVIIARIVEKVNTIIYVVAFL